MTLEAEEIMIIYVRCDGLYETGIGLDGSIRIIPIVGGEFSGRNISGKILPGGADWNTKKTSRFTHVFAKYTLETNDGCYISVENEGTYDKENLTAIKTTPRFVTALDGPYAYLNTGVYVAELNSVISKDKTVEVVVYKLL